MAATTPDAVAPPVGNPRFPLLDGTRALAALMVVLTHGSALTTFGETNPLGGVTARLNVGVTLFFLLSGFLLYRPYVAARRRGSPPIAFGPYLWRRVLRIVPAYWLALTLLALWPGLEGFWDGEWWKAYLFLTVYSYDSFFVGIDPAWSLCVEVTFYLALPVLAALIGRLAGRSVRRELLVLAALALASLVARVVFPLDSAVQNTIVCNLDWFVVGMAFATLSVVHEGREERLPALVFLARHPWATWAAAGVVLLVVSYGFGLPRDFRLADGHFDAYVQHLGYALFSALVLAPAVFGTWGGGAPRRLLAHRAVAWTGLISYGIYLWHMPLMKWLQDSGAQDWLPGSRLLSLTVLGLAMAVVAATASYYLVERPLLRLKGKGSSASTRARASRASAPDAAAETALQATELSGSAATASRASSSA